MKNIKKLLYLFLGATLVMSCVEDDTTFELNGESPNLAGFANSTQTLAGIASGDSYTRKVVMKLIGPTVEAFQGDVSVSVARDEASTAIEGTHFSFPSNSLVLKRDNNYIGELPITLLTDGIDAPLDEAPILYLKVTDAEGENVVGNGKKIKITLNYLCNSELAGDYSAAYTYVHPDLGTSTGTYIDTWTEVSSGTYRTLRVGHWTPAQLGGTPGMTVQDVCDKIIINEQNLVDLYSNLVDDKGIHGSRDPLTGTITVDYKICASYCREYNVVYTKL
jgi:hypothetical protein